MTLKIDNIHSDNFLSLLNFVHSKENKFRTTRKIVLIRSIDLMNADQDETFYSVTFEFRLGCVYDDGKRVDIPSFVAKICQMAHRETTNL